jgi:hypothetical protein
MISPAGMTHDLTNFRTQIQLPLYDFLREIHFVSNPTKTITVK